MTFNPVTTVRHWQSDVLYHNIVIAIPCLLTMYAIETIDTVYRIVHYCVTSKNNVDRSCQGQEKYMYVIVNVYWNEIQPNVVNINLYFLLFS
jgi:hypothetical protein